MLAAVAVELERVYRGAMTTVLVECYLQTSRQVCRVKAKRHAENDNNQLLKYDDRLLAPLPL